MRLYAHLDFLLEQKKRAEADLLLSIKPEPGILTQFRATARQRAEQ
jgi:hypothetical protein